MSIVDKVIYDALARRRDVVLPGVGSLEVKRRKAKKISEDRIIPPQNVVLYRDAHATEGKSVISLLISARGANQEEAKAMYDSWLESARFDKGVKIENVGEINAGRFIIAQPLHAELNPTENADAVIMKKERKERKEEKIGPLWVWILAGLVLAAATLVALSCLGDGFPNVFKKSKPVEVVIPVVIPVPIAVEPTAEELMIEALKQTALKPAFHVIAGSFVEQSNADNYVKILLKSYPELPIQKIKSARNGNWLVSVSNAPTEREAYNNMNKYWHIDLDLWVYDRK